MSINPLLLAHPIGPGPSDRGDLAAVIIIPALCLMVGWLAWVLTRTRHLRTKADIEIRSRLLDRVQSARDLSDLLETDQGRRVLRSLSQSGGVSREEIVGGLQKGIVFILIGAGGLCVHWLYPMGYGLFIAASLLLGAAGIGFVVSAGAAYALAKSWGELPRKAAGSNSSDGAPGSET